MKVETIMNHLEKYGNCFLGNKTINRNNRVEKVIKVLEERGVHCTYAKGTTFPNNFVIQKVKKSTSDKTQI